MSSVPVHAAGRPYTVDVKGSNTLSLDDVMIGDVWFASGQSNMEMPLKGFGPNTPIQNSAAEIQAANQPKLARLLRIQKSERPTFRWMTIKTLGRLAHRRRRPISRQLLIFLDARLSSNT